MLKHRIAKLEQAMKQLPDVEDAERWAELFAIFDDRQPNEAGRQEAREFLRFCRGTGQKPSWVALMAMAEEEPA